MNPALPPAGQLETSSSPTVPQLCFEVSTVNGEPRVKPLVSNGRLVKRRRKKYLEISVSGGPPVKVYQARYRDRRRRKVYRSRLIVYHQGGRRRREKRADPKIALEWAEQIAVNLANGQSAMNAFGQDDRASYLRASELARKTGKPLELLVAEYVEAWEILAGRATLKEAAVFQMEHRPSGGPVSNVPDLVVDLLKARRADGIGKRWARSLEEQLERFAEYWTGPLHLLRSGELNLWLRNLGVGPRTRANYRAAILQLTEFAKANGQLADGWNELDKVDAPEIPDAEIRVLIPAQMEKLLSVCPDSLVPFVCLAGFAGLRHEELASESEARLQWQDIDLEKKLCYVPRGVAKTGEDRELPLQENVVAWLLRYRKKSGAVCALSNASNALCRAKQKAGIAHGKNQTRNTLRKSYISYRKALTKDVARVADEAGTSVAKIKSNYRRHVSEDEARAWFGIWPESPGVIQLPLAL